MPFIKEPKIPFIIDLMIKISEKIIGGRMMPARLLLWTPKAFISSMILEGLITRKKGKVTPRMLKLIRMQASLSIECPFCIDMNCFRYEKFHITESEINALQGIKSIKDVSSFNYEEKLALYYARNVVRTPININPKLVNKMIDRFSEAEFTTIVTTIGQVDYWTRVIQGLGIQPAGFLDKCDLKKMTGD